MIPKLPDLTTGVKPPQNNELRPFVGVQLFSPQKLHGGAIGKKTLQYCKNNPPKSCTVRMESVTLQHSKQVTTKAMIFTTQQKRTDRMMFNGKVNTTKLNREVRIRYYEKNEDGSYKKNRLVTARQLCEILGEKNMLSLLKRFAKFQDDGDFTAKFRKAGMVQFSWR